MAVSLDLIPSDHSLSDVSSTYSRETESDSECTIITPEYMDQLWASLNSVYPYCSGDASRDIAAQEPSDQENQDESNLAYASDLAISSTIARIVQETTVFLQQRDRAASQESRNRAHAQKAAEQAGKKRAPSKRAPRKRAVKKT